MSRDFVKQIKQRTARHRPEPVASRPVAPRGGVGSMPTVPPRRVAEVDGRAHPVHRHSSAPPASGTKANPEQAKRNAKGCLPVLMLIVAAFVAVPLIPVLTQPGGPDDETKRKIVIGVAIGAFILFRLLVKSAKPRT